MEQRRAALPRSPRTYTDALDPPVPYMGTLGVRIVSKRRIREFDMRYPKAAEPLKHWANAVQSAAWKNPGALKRDFGSADFVGDLTVFNVGGNKYRLIAFVHYRRQIVYVKQILTHEEYDEGEWKL
jgi:mRNA interferase HigB